MPITTRTVVEASCDECQAPIATADRYIDASVYGVAFHEQCWQGIGGPRVARVLGLDDIHIKDGALLVERAWGPR